MHCTLRYRVYDENDEEKCICDVSFDISPRIPARTSGDPDECHPAEGGEIENLVVKLDGNVIHETKWKSLGIIEDDLYDYCLAYAQYEMTRQYWNYIESKIDEGNERRHGMKN